MFMSEQVVLSRGRTFESQVPDLVHRHLHSRRNAVHKDPDLVGMVIVSEGHFCVGGDDPMVYIM